VWILGVRAPISSPKGCLVVLFTNDQGVGADRKTAAPGGEGREEGEGCCVGAGGETIH